MNNSADQQTLLIVDDEPGNIRLLQTLFKEKYRLLAATNGEKALQIAKSVPHPDLILLDVMMPDMDGFEVLEQLKDCASTKDIAVLFVTAKLEEEDENKGLSLGALDYIIKPINATAVKIKVQTHLDAIRQRKFIESLVEEQADSIMKHSHAADLDHQRSEKLIKKYLQTINEERDRLQLALWASGNELWDWDLKTGEIRRNNEYDVIVMPKDTTNKDVFELYAGFVHPNDMPRFRTTLGPVLIGSERDFELEYRIRCEKQDWLWVRDQGRVIAFDEDGAPIRIVGTIKDIHERKLVERKSQMLASAMKNTSDGVWIANSDFQIEFVNEAFSEITGWSKDEVIGNEVALPVTDKQDEDFVYRIKEELIRNDKWSGEVWAQGKDRIYPEELRIDVVHNDEDDTVIYVGVFTDITFRKRAEDELIQLANYDQLTGLPNRTLFNERLRQITKKGRIPPAVFALLFIDLDNFKRVNDSLGHPVGDQLLISVAESLNSVLRSQDFVARIGGDEFVMIVDHIDHTHVAAKVANRIIDSIGKIRELNGHHVVVTPSIGITVFPEDAETGEALLKNADRAMYVSKSKGKNGYQFYNESMNSDALERLDLEAGLREAIENDDIELHYQPKVDLESGEIDGLEVLARWCLNGTFVSPEVFIKIAEEAGFINKLGERLLYKACSQYKKWNDMGLARGRIAVNLSGKQFQDERLVEKVTKVLAETGLPADKLELEITESMVVDETERAIEKMHQLRDLGIALSIDDFGTGYSSLSYLKEFPVNTLKIDRCFIDDMLKTKRSRNIVELIVDMAHTLDMHVVAEGVETAEQAELIKTMHAEEIQGYLFSKPLPPEEFENLLKNNLNLHDKLCSSSGNKQQLIDMSQGSA